jgi:hypothetical protein
MWTSAIIEVEVAADRSTCLADAVVGLQIDLYLGLAETLNTFLTRLRSSAGALDVSERQRVMRLLVKEVLVGDDKIIIRHCIPLPNRSGDGPPDGGINTAPPGTEGYLLRSRSHHRTLAGSTVSYGYDPIMRKVTERVGILLSDASAEHIEAVSKYLPIDLMRVLPRRMLRAA